MSELEEMKARMAQALEAARGIDTTKSKRRHCHQALTSRTMRQINHSMVPSIGGSSWLASGTVVWRAGGRGVAILVWAYAAWREGAC